VKIVRGDLVGDEERAAAFAFRRQVDKIGKPVDKTEWGMTPPTVNAYYNPPENNINFPAGILQPPFYFQGGDDAANYGAIGAVVGHELTHGFDDSGRQYDGEGNLRDWWTAADAKSFKDRADCIVNEYGNFVASGDVKLNGRLTLGENGADNGGLRLAYMAMMDSLANHTMPNTAKDGLTPEQRFFIAWGQVWCQNITDQAARLQALTNPHSLGRYRANGVVQNMPEFGKAFGCHEGQPMVSPNSCRVW
jgi:predicted metalloendopeptidase